MARDLKNQVIIITGASAGIGAVTAIACARAEMDVLLSARRAEKLEEVAAAVRAAGRKAHIVAGDVAQPGFSERLLDEAQNHFGRFDVVFANAGYGIEKPIIRADEEEIRRMFEVNFFASLTLVSEAARRLIAHDRSGHLLMCSSAVAKFTLPYYGLYSATKAAQNLVCRSMRLELEHHGIDVSSVHPISTRTEFSDVVAALSHPHGAHGRVAEHSPSMFIQPAERVANAIVKCLRHPRPEVWTSFSTRLAAGLMTFSPRFGDFFMRRVRKVIEKARPDLRD